MLTWLKKNWKYLLLIPLIFFLWSKGRSLILYILTGRTPLPAPGTAVTQQTEAINQKTDRKVQEILKKAENTKTGIDGGDPKPSEVFNTEIKK